ncbi:MAG: SIMPL domain-containing protein [Bacteroidia bacterium]
MKTVFLFIGLLFIQVAGFAEEKLPKQGILVNGSAQKEIVPDEIYIEVELKEFTKDKKKFKIEELEASLLNFIEKKTLVPRKDIKMAETDQSLLELRRQIKDVDLTKSYEIKFSNFNQVMLLIGAMDSLNCKSAIITKLWHSKMEEYKKEVRIAAMKSASEQATYMLEAVGSKRGKPLVVADGPGGFVVDMGLNRGKNNYKVSYEEESLSNSYTIDRQLIDIEDPISSHLIKLSYTVSVTFEIL